MKKQLSIFFAIYLLGLSFLPHLDSRELLKLPNLLAHFQQHQSAEKLSFTGFIEKHYFNPEHKDAPEHNHHQDLPFHKQHSCMELAISLPDLLEVQTSLPAVLTAPVPYYKYPAFPEFTGTLFQPPKVLLA